MAKSRGGNKLAAALTEIAKNLASAKSVQVGFPEDATYPDGTSVALVAALNEFGSGNTPPRPFFRGMIAKESPQWPDAIKENLKATGYDADKTLTQVGEAISGQLQEAITTFSGEPLSPKTIATKGSDKQLVDTSQMLQSVTYRLKT